jgi:hypothetical protein
VQNADMTDDEKKKLYREGLADMLVELAAKIRSGETEATNISQSMPITRYWSDDQWHFFRLKDYELTLTYYNIELRKAEQKKLEEYLAANPLAECHGLPDIPRN